MRQTAELGALTGVNARLVCLDAIEMDSTWNRITLSVQRRNPV
jgi:hypothetical protein